MSGQNAATRVHSVIAHAAAVDGQLPALEGLFELFHLGHLPANAGSGRLAAQRMNLLLDQIDRIESGLRAAGVPAALWSNGLEQARTGFSPMLLGGAWQEVMRHFGPEVSLTLQWAAHVLPADDGEVDQPLSGQMLLDIEEVQMLAEQIELPEVLREFVTGHMHALQEGLRVSVISGLQPLRDAIKTVAGDLALRQDTLNDAIAELDAEARAVCNRVSTVVKKAMELVNLASGAANARQKLGAASGNGLTLLAA
ncbi:MAG: hypothetical protein RJA44_1543 [Pseudomonadota bacterium]